MGQFLINYYNLGENIIFLFLNFSIDIKEVIDVHFLFS